MSQGSLCHRKYNYNNLDGKGLFQAIDAHDVIVKCRLQIFLSYFGVAVFLTITFYLIMMKEISKGVPSAQGSHQCRVWGGSMYIANLWFFLNNIESVVIMPAFDVQLETHYWRMEMLDLPYIIT
ncbi:unnamed protein product [Musa banksii]